MEGTEQISSLSGTIHVETVCCLYHQKKDFISVTYEPKDADYLKQTKRNKSIQPKEVGAGKYSLEGRK